MVILNSYILDSSDAGLRLILNLIVSQAPSYSPYGITRGMGDIAMHACTSVDICLGFIQSFMIGLLVGE